MKRKLRIRLMLLIGFLCRKFYCIGFFYYKYLKFKGLYKENSKNGILIADALKQFMPSCTADEAEQLKEDICKSMAINYIKPEEYFFYDFPKKKRIERNSFVGRQEGIYFFSLLKSKYYDLFDDKWQTYQQFEKFFLRKAIRITSTEDKENFFSFVESMGKVIVKITDGTFGQGVFAADGIAEARLVFSAISKMLEEGKSAIAEQYVQQCKEMSALNPTSVNTIRISTFLDGDNVIKMFSFLRIGRNGAVVDNGGAGGLIVSVNLETGVCETHGITEALETFEFHPDTKVKIKGFKIPRWEEALKLSEELASVVPQQRYASWDLALTDNGWVMIEGNSKGMFIGPQLTTQKGIRDIAEKTFYKYI